VIGDDRGRNHRQLAGTPAIQNVGQAVIGFRDQQHHAAMAGAVAHLPVHTEPIGDRGEAGLQRGQIDCEIGGVEHHAHEEMPGLDVIELLGVENVLPVMSQERRHRGYDPRAVRAGKCQDELMIGHGCDEISDDGIALRCHALSPATALRQSRIGDHDEQRESSWVIRSWPSD